MHARFERPRPEGFRWAPGTSLIWLPSEVATHFEPPRLSWVWFRKRFTVAAGGTVRLRLCADTRYRAWIDGVQIGFGPSRSDPRWQEVDVWEVPLAAGEHVLAVLALHQGFGTGQSLNRYPMLVGDVSLGGERLLATDAAWRCRKAPDIDVDAPRLNGCQGVIEVRDRRVASDAWCLPDHDDSAWEPVAARDPGLCPFWNWRERTIPAPALGEAEAISVVARGTVKARPGPHLAEQFLAEQPVLVAAEGAARELTLVAGEVITVDFGRIEAGWLRIEATGAASAVLDALYGEELLDLRVTLSRGANRAADRGILRGGRDAWEVQFGWKAFRYVQFIARAPLTIHRVVVATRAFDETRFGSFSGDPALTQLWNLSARTLALCTQDGLLDSPSREQQQWMGDGRFQALMHHWTSGDTTFHRRIIEHFAMSQDAEGMTTSRYPDAHHNYPPIPSFTLHWVIAAGEYVAATGDLEPIRRWWPNLLAALRWFTGFAGDDCLPVDVPYWPFIDWGDHPGGQFPDVGATGVITPLCLLYLEATRAAVVLAERLGDRDAACWHRVRAAQLDGAIRGRLWDDERGCYRDRNGGDASESTNALALLLLPDAARDARIRAAWNGLRRASPFFQVIVVRALALHDRRAALAHIAQRYAPMLAAGATAVWETWRLENHGSLQSASHAWGAVALVAVPEVLFGLRPLGDGFRRLRVDPLPGAGMGVFPTPGGTWRLRVDDTGFDLEIPAGCEAEVVGRTLPAGTYRLAFGSTAVVSR